MISVDIDDDDGGEIVSEASTRRSTKRMKSDLHAHDLPMSPVTCVRPTEISSSVRKLQFMRAAALDQQREESLSKQRDALSEHTWFVEGHEELVRQQLKDLR